MNGQSTVAQGPFFDELCRGQRFRAATRATLTDGLAAAHQAILGDRFPLSSDAALAHAVTGGPALAAPSLVWDISIGQSTAATQHVKANLFYRGLAFHRLPRIGDTLDTVTEVVGLRQNSARPGRPATGLVVLRISTTDQHGATVLDFWRCAMLPLRDQHRETGHHDDFDAIGSDGAVEPPTELTDWDLTPVHARPEWAGGLTHRPGQVISVLGGDVVSSAPELARLTHNVARVHHDRSAAGGRRLVYGGHTIGLAAVHATRALPGLLTIIAWEGCDHVGPVHEDDVLTSAIQVVDMRRIGSLALVDLRSIVTANEADTVLDWRFTAVFAA